MKQEIIRCRWAESFELMQQYHDNEWGRPEHDDSKLFELLILEGMQAGLSWAGILNKRENYRLALDGFEYKKIALYGEAKLEQLMHNPGIIRNRLKNKAIITNAQAFIKVQQQHGSFDSFIWAYVNNQPIINNIAHQQDMPVKSEVSEQISMDLKKLGFKFVGPVIIYSYMQAIGMIDDHINDCAFKTNHLLTQQVDSPQGAKPME